MKITHRGPADADLSKLVQNDKNVGHARKEGESKAGQAGQSSKVNISKQARELQRIAELARQGDDLRAEKVKQIKEQIARGDYQVDSKDVSKDIVRSEIARLFEKK
jgi:negative regulator of flagellin synthesis FlgM